ncbi:MAG: BsuPI-related putative proteinase inhibitor, partial [Gammaproteobacteria bacterium]
LGQRIPVWKSGWRLTPKGIIAIVVAISVSTVASVLTLRPGRLASGCGEVPPQVAKPDGVSVNLSIDDQKLASGQPLRMVLELRNAGRRLIDFSHGGQRYDFWIEGPGGRVWIWSDFVIHTGAEFQQYLRAESLAPGETRRAEQTWRQTSCSGHALTLKPGRYVVRGAWISSEVNDSWWSNQAEFEIR